jgi:hypothetical protein
MFGDGGGGVHNQLFVLSRDRDRVSAWKTGVSLHSHTRHSQEGLGFIAAFFDRHTLTRRWYAGQRESCRQVTGIDLDLARAHWTPPLCEQMAQAVEERQIEQLGLRPMVSLTDHNSIEACLLLRQDPAHADAPISSEWTVPFGGAVFHFGIHNLPVRSTPELMAAMHQATFLADEDRILKLFAELSATPGVLVVFNHPLWNFYSIPTDRFMYELTRFLEAGNRYVHAFELNGMRSHAENRAALDLAAKWDQVVISGGDRHGIEPNASLNLTNAADFPEFVEEVREGRQSTVMVMPQYAAPLCWRLYRNFTHVVADYPEHPAERRRWDQRTFHPDRDGAIVPMRGLWKNGDVPDFLKTMFGAATVAAQVPFDGLLRRWMRRENEALKLPHRVEGAGYRVQTADHRVQIAGRRSQAVGLASDGGEL